MITVKYRKSGHGINRNVLYSDIPGVRFKKSVDLFKAINFFYYRMFGRSAFLSESLFPFNQKKNQIWHLFNGINFGNNPWVTTFETILPRWSGIKSESLLKKGVQRLADDSCKRLIAMSSCAKELQEEFLMEKYKNLGRCIIEKTEVLLPPQRLIISDYSEKKLNQDVIEFTFVGALFFLKGGMEILKAFDYLLEKNYPVKLNIVSTLKYGDFASQTTETDYSNAKKLIEKNKASINHYDYLPNEKVLELLKRTHVALLPSYADTFGFFVLEAQAAGCPVITTDIRAMPEINNNEVGWLIEVPKKSNRKAAFDSEKDRYDLSRIIIEKLIVEIEGAIDNSTKIKEKGEKSLHRVLLNHDLENHINSLKNIYNCAIA